MGRDIKFEKRIIPYRVVSEYLGIRTSDNNLFLFYKPSSIWYSERAPYAGLGAFLIAIGLLMMIFGYGLYRTEFIPQNISIIGLSMLIFGIFMLIVGAVLALMKECGLLIETHAGTRIWFKNPGITDRDVGAILTQFAEEYKKKAETEKITYSAILLSCFLIFFLVVSVC